MARKQQSKDKAEDGKPVYVTLVKNGEIIKKAFTYNEAKNEGILSPTGYALIDSDDPGPLGGGSIVCSSHGYTQKDFEKTGRLGCPHCYDTFRVLVQPLLERMHKGTRHLGKIPRNVNAQEVLVAKVDHLKQKLDSAISSERFEDAAQIRDDIDGLEKKIN